MGGSCVFLPEKGAKTFLSLKRAFGYKKAVEVFNILEHSEFQNDYRDSLQFEEGIPTFESVMSNSYIQEQLGKEEILKYNNSKFSPIENTLSNYESLLAQANTYNRGNNPYIAIVNYTEDGRLKINLYPKNETNLEKFKTQYAVFKLNRVIIKALENIGISPESLTEAEERAGRRGLTLFQAATTITGDAIALIKVANNAEGYQALSEEFAHLLVDNLSDRPIIQRALKFLTDNIEVTKSILGEEYDNVSDFYEGREELVAEEALGKLLQEGLLNNMKDAPKENKSLFERAGNYIKNLFKKVNPDPLIKGISDIQLEMDNVAKQFLEGTVVLDKKKINKRNRNIAFNSLSERIEANIKALQEAVEIEVKRGAILKADAATMNSRIAKIEQYAHPNADTALGVMNYAYTGLRILRRAYQKFEGLDLLPLNERFKTIQEIKTIMQSFGSFIHTLYKLQSEENADSDKLYNRTFTFNIQGLEEYDLDGIIRDLNHLIEQIGIEYNKVNLPMWGQFIREQLGEEVVKYIEEHCADGKALEELFTQEMDDISLHDLWLNSMGDTNNIIAQIFDKLLKTANDRARMRAYDLIQEIQATRIWAEQQGFDSFDWIFEKDSKGNFTGNYVNIDDGSPDSGSNIGEFQRARKEAFKNIEDNETLSESEKIQQKEDWLSENGWWDNSGKIHPKKEKYPAVKLNPKQIEVYNKILDLKDRMDALYPKSRVTALKAIQIRKDSLQRLMDSSHGISDFITNYKEALKASFGVSETDDSEYGDVGGLTKFDGTEFMTLPVLYTNRLKNPNELSTDIFGSLMSYAISTTKYDELSEIVAPIEVGRDIVVENLSKNINKKAGNKQFKETINKYGKKISRNIHTSEESNLIRKINEFIETQLYQRYLKDEGTFNFLGIEGWEVNKSKFWRRVLSMNSTAQLAFNWLANMANVTQGKGMQNIEAAAGQFFDHSEMRSADAEFAKEIIKVMAECNARNKTNFLDLFDDFMNVRQNYGNSKKDQRAAWALRLFGKDVEFLGQEAGDFWLYNRAAIAYCLRLKVKYKGQTMSFYQLLKDYGKKEIEIDGKKTGAYKLEIPEGVTTENGEVVDRNFATKHSRAIAHINQNCFGIYNQDDKTLAERYVFGLAVTQYRKWMKPLFNNRFKSKRTNLDTLRDEEGYYRTFGRMVKDMYHSLKRGEGSITAVWNSLEDDEKANVKKAWREIWQFLALLALIRLAPWPDDDDDELNDNLSKRAITMTEYCMVRLKQELGAVIPGTTMTNDMLKTVKSPFAVLSSLASLSNFVGSLFDPDDWTHELQSGRYKGHSRVYRNFMKLPFAPQSYYRQFDRVYNGMDAAIQYYKTPAVY